MASNMTKLRGLTPEAMNKEEHALRESIWRFRLQLTTGQLQDPQKVRSARQNLARLLTVKRESQLKQARESGS